MRFSLILLALGAAAVNGATLATRQLSETCIGALKALDGDERSFVYPLFDECNHALGTVEAKQNPWTNSVCVAAAIATDMRMFHDALTCAPDHSNSTDLPPISEWPNLDYNTYADIVGDCAWASGGCPITQQNFIDLIYGSIAKETSQTPVYPDSADTLIKFYLEPVFNWTGFTPEQGIPYTNFNDWLHYSGDINHCVPNFSNCS